MKPSLIAALILALIAVVQFLRAMMGWVVVINGYTVPLWVSVVAGLVTGVVATLVCRESCATKIKP